MCINPLSRPWPVFRERHHDRIRYMSHRLKPTLKQTLKITAGESKRLKIWPSPTVLDRFPGRGGRFSSILDVGRHAKLKGSWSNFGTINSSSTFSSNHWLDDPCVWPTTGWRRLGRSYRCGVVLRPARVCCGLVGPRVSVWRSLKIGQGRPRPAG